MRTTLRRSLWAAAAAAVLVGLVQADANNPLRQDMGNTICTLTQEC